MDKINCVLQIAIIIGTVAALAYGAIWWTPWYQKIRNNRRNRNEVK